MINIQRPIRGHECAVLQRLLELSNSAPDQPGDPSQLLVVEMADGGMGSLRLAQPEAGEDLRTFGRQIAAGEFVDSDGTPVSVTLNVDREGRLFELDMWKADFSPLLRWPSAESVVPALPPEDERR
jgi:hypothetical protein